MSGANRDAMAWGVVLEALKADALPPPAPEPPAAHRRNEWPAMGIPAI